MRPLAMKLDVVSTIASSTSMMSTKGMTLMVSKPLSSMADFPLQDQDLHFAQQEVVERNGDQRDKQSYRRRFQRKRQAGHNPAHVDRAVLTHVVEGEHDAQDRAEQADVGRVAADRTDDEQLAGQCQFQGFYVGEIRRLRLAIERQALAGDGYNHDTQREQ